MGKRKSKNNKSNQRKAWIITISIHILLLIIFLLWKYELPPLKENNAEDLLEIALGTEEEGLGNDPDMNMDDPAPTNSNESSVNNSNNTSRKNEENVELNNENVPNPIVVKKPNTTKEKETKRNQENIQQPKPKKVLNPNSNSSSDSKETVRKGKHVMPGSSGSGGNQADRNQAGSGSGNTSGNGTKGTPGGNPNGKLYVTNSFKDRKIKSAPSPNAKYNQGGQVKIRVTINREGKIINHKVESAASNELRTLATQKIKEVSFYPAQNALPEQSGYIIFNFSTGNK